MTAAFTIDDREIPFEPGQTIMEAATAAGVYIPHLCHHPGFAPHGSCKLCTVSVDGRNVTSCTTRATAGAKVSNESEALREDRRTLVQMLFVEGNHICPACEKSGNCRLQAVAYHVGMTTPGFDHLFPARDHDMSHPDVWLERNRCILCELCVRASRDVDRKSVFVIANRGIRARLEVDSPSGLLGDSALAADDRAVAVCPVGALMRKRVGYAVPIGSRTYDRESVAEAELALARPGKDRDG